MKSQLDPDGRLPLGAPCKIVDGRDAKVVRRSAIREAFTLGVKGGKNHFKKVWLYDAQLLTDDGEKVWQRRITLDERFAPEAGGKA